MNVTEAIEQATSHFRQAGNFNPSHCDVRCLINDLVSNEISRRGYDQTRAWLKVRRKLGNPVPRSVVAIYRKTNRV